MDDNKLTKLSSCGGWGAKVGAGTLDNILKGFKKYDNKNLLVGYDTNDDASIYKVSDDVAIIESLDFFPPIVDDPYTFGQIVAANSLSDIYAMGGKPTTALNILCLKKGIDDSVTREVLKGGYEKAYEAECTIAGGHTINGEELLYGLSVSGIINPNKIYTNANAKVGDVLIQTKKLGIGILTTALKGGLLSKQLENDICRQMSTLNKYAFLISNKYKINSLTDITGFSLLGHSYEMAKGSNVTININSQNLSFYTEALEFADMGFVPEGNSRNVKFTEGHIDFKNDIKQNIIDVMFSPETSGGLLISMPESDAKECIVDLKNNHIDAEIIGFVTEYKNKYINVI